MPRTYKRFAGLMGEYWCVSNSTFVYFHQQNFNSPMILILTSCNIFQCNCCKNCTLLHPVKVKSFCVSSRTLSRSIYPSTVVNQVNHFFNLFLVYLFSNVLPIKFSIAFYWTSGFSHSSEKLVDMYDYVGTVSNELNLVFVVSLILPDTFLFPFLFSSSNSCIFCEFCSLLKICSSDVTR